MAGGGRKLEKEGATAPPPDGGGEKGSEGSRMSRAIKMDKVRRGSSSGSFVQSEGLISSLTIYQGGEMHRQKSHGPKPAGNNTERGSGRHRVKKILAGILPRKQEGGLPSPTSGKMRTKIKGTTFRKKIQNGKEGQTEYWAERQGNT